MSGGLNAPAKVTAPVAAVHVVDVDDWQPLSPAQLAETLLFYRRRLAEKLAIEMIRLGCPRTQISNDPVEIANAIAERLAARETGKAEGYK